MGRNPSKPPQAAGGPLVASTPPRRTLAELMHHERPSNLTADFLDAPRTPPDAPPIVKRHELIIPPRTTPGKSQAITDPTVGTFGTQASDAFGMDFFEKSRQSNFSQIQSIADVLEGEEQATQIGVCAGLSTVWMNLHHAKPGSSSDARMQTLGSFEGMHHALVFQRSYVTNLKHLDLHAGFSAARQSEARADLDEVYGVSRDMLTTQRTTSAAAMAQTMRDVDGYASIFFVRTDKTGDQTGHELIMHRNPADGVITLFDANHGEFRFQARDAVRFLQSVHDMHGQKDDQSFEWRLTKVRPNSGSAAPLGGLISALDDHQDSMSPACPPARAVVSQ